MLYGTEPQQLEPIIVPIGFPVQNPEPPKPKIEEPDFLYTPREKALITILRYFPKNKREAVYNYVDELRNIKN